jgi:DNA-binding transcriptional MerR regulator
MANLVVSLSREPASSMPEKKSATKSASAFRTISEVAEQLEVPQHVLRFWETKFSTVRPLKRGGGRRYYRPEDIDLIRQIRNLLYADGYTIKGVQRLMREGHLKTAASLAAAKGGKPAAPARSAKAAEDRGAGDVQIVIAELGELRDMLRRAVK